MQLNYKILLPILFLFLIILATFGYLLFYIDRETSKISIDSNRFKQINTVSDNLAKEQEVTEYYILSYIFVQNPDYLKKIDESDLNKAKNLDEIYKYINTDEEKELINEYIVSRKDIYKTRNNLLRAIQTKDPNLINRSYSQWNNQTEKIREAIVQIQIHNGSQLANILENFRLIGERIGQAVIGLILVLFILIIILFYFLKYTITEPIISMSKYSEDVANKNFSKIVNNPDPSLLRNDEIGTLYKSFVNMSKIVRDSYESLERAVRDRTQDLRKRTEELEEAGSTNLKLISDLNAERQTLLEMRALDTAILSSIGDALVVIDTEGVITYVNQAFESITGWKSKESIGKKFIELVPSENDHHERIPDVERFISKILKGANPKNDFVNTVYYIRKDGSRFPVSSIVRRVTIDGKLVGAVKTFSDVTMMKSIDTAKTEFVALAAHQLRTPLSAISWYTEMLLSGDAGKLNTNQEKFLNQIYDANQRMIAMVLSFLYASRIEMGTLENEKTKINIKQIMESVIEEQLQKIEKKKIQLDLVTENEELPTLFLDQNRIRMCFQNLLSNAIKYTPNEGKITISLINDYLNRQVLIKFADTGLGIPQEYQDKIFTKLFRAANVVERGTDGTGLGLYIVKSIVENSGGKIWFTSKENEGTTFYVSLPVA